MGFVEKSDVKKLLKDSRVMATIAKAVAKDPGTLDSLAGDFADKLSDELENDPAMRQRIVETAIASPGFKNKVVTKVVEDFS